MQTIKRFGNVSTFTMDKELPNCSDQVAQAALMFDKVHCIISGPFTPTSNLTA
jgi:hypothetical protein